MKNAVVVVASLLALFSAITPEAQSRTTSKRVPRVKSQASKAHTPQKKMVRAASRTKRVATVAVGRSKKKGVWARKPSRTVTKTIAKVKARGTGRAVVAQAVVRPSPYSYTAPWNQVARMTHKESNRIRQDFAAGKAAQYTPQQLAKAGLLTKKSLWGGIFERAEPIKYIVMHSTETARPASAPQIIQSWNNRGLRHPGTPFMVDRDGKIYVTVDPNYGTVHIEPTRAKWGVTNSNSIGIEMVHTGKQKYTQKQMASVSRLVAYLQKRYSVSSDRIYSHGFVQPSDRTDPVGFDWAAFNLAKANLSQTVMVAETPQTSEKRDKQSTNGVQQYGWLKAAAFGTPAPKPAPSYRPALFALSGHGVPMAPDLVRKLAN